MSVICPLELHYLTKLIPMDADLFINLPLILQLLPWPLPTTRPSFNGTC
jgi:hypothetical protein